VQGNVRNTVLVAAAVDRADEGAAQSQSRSNRTFMIARRRDRSAARSLSKASMAKDRHFDAGPGGHDSL
jgi:hypothetical protein